MPTILAFDPGVTTGYAYVSFDKGVEPSLVNAGQILGGHRGFIKAWDLLPKADILVCESFTLREGIRGVNPEPCYVIGALEALRYDAVNYQPAAFKTFCDNTALKNLDMYIPGQQHARDAIRHAIGYLRTKELHIQTLKKGWPD